MTAARICACGRQFERKLRKRGMCNRCRYKEWINLPGNREREKARLEGRDHTGRKRNKIYGLTREEYDAAMAKPCGICLIKPSVHFDHDHVTGRNRGGLCHRCNISLGYVEGWFVEHREAALAWMTKGRL